MEIVTVETGFVWTVGGGSTTVVDNLTTASATSALSANQGVVLKGLIDGIEQGGDAVTLNGQDGAYYLSRANHSGSIPAANVTEDATHRFATDAEKTAWNAKQDALGFTPVATTDPRLSDARTPTAHTHPIAEVTGLQAELDSKSTQADIDSAIAALIDGAPGTIDTLNELAAALGDDPNFAASVTTALSGKEPTIPAGTSAQYYRGDKVMASLNKSAVGLANVDNTSDANKPISSATQTALNGKAASVHTHTIDQVTGLQTSLDAKADAAATTAALNTKANTADLATVATSGAFNDLTGKPRYEVLAALPGDLSGYPDGSRIVVTG